MESPQDQQPWTILGLDGATTPTEQEVKRAYAKLIKQHRPDTDPEGFQRVQTAYRAALQIISQSPLPTVVPVETALPTPHGWRLWADGFTLVAATMFLTLPLLLPIVRVGHCSVKHGCSLARSIKGMLHGMVRGLLLLLLRRVVM